MGLIMWDHQVVPVRSGGCTRDVHLTPLNDTDIDASLDLIDRMRSSLDILTRRVNDLNAPQSLSADEYAALLNIRFNDDPVTRRRGPVTASSQYRRDRDNSTSTADNMARLARAEQQRRQAHSIAVNSSVHEHNSPIRDTLLDSHTTSQDTTAHDSPSRSSDLPGLISDSSASDDSSDSMPALVSFATPEMLARWIALGAHSEAHPNTNTHSHSNTRTRQHSQNSAHTSRSHTARSHAARAYALRRRRETDMPNSSHARDSGREHVPHARTIVQDLQYPLSPASRMRLNDMHTRSSLPDSPSGSSGASDSSMGNTVAASGALEFGRVSPDFNWVLPGQVQQGNVSSQGSMDDIFDTDSGHIFADMNEFLNSTRPRTSAQVGNTDGFSPRAYSHD